MLKRLFRLPTLIQASFAFLRLVKNPNELKLVFDLSERIAEPQDLQKICQYVEQRSDVAQRALQELPRIQLDGLYRIRKQLKAGSLGFEFLKYLEERNLNPSDIPNLPAQSKEEFVLAHLYETHDLWHVLTGFETDVAGELGLQAFYFAQLPLPLSSVLLGGGFLNTTLFSMDERDQRMNQIVKGWQMGTSAKPLFGVCWAQYWETPLDEIRKEFRVGRVSN